MLLGLSLSVSWICLLFSSTVGFPATKSDYRYPYTATWGSSGGSAPAPADPSPSDFDGSSGLPGVEQPAGGAEASSYDFSNWLPSQPFPDFRPWSSASNVEMPEGVSETSPVLPLPPSSYIIQSRNGYVRAREVMSNTHYAPPEYPVPPPFPMDPVREPSKTGPVTGPGIGVKM